VCILFEGANGGAASVCVDFINLVPFGKLSCHV
jgi:hypothetical protein